MSLRQIERFGTTRNVGDPRNLAQVQLQRFVDQQFVEASVFAQDERVVQTRHEQNVLHAERHEVLEAFEALFGIENMFGDVGQGHGNDEP